MLKFPERDFWNIVYIYFNYLKKINIIEFIRSIFIESKIFYSVYHKTGRAAV